MNPADNKFERQLREMELRRPPAAWKALLLPPAVVPWLPTPLLIGLAFCWAATAGFFLTTPGNEGGSPPLLPAATPPANADFLLGYAPPDETHPP